MIDATSANENEEDMMLDDDDQMMMQLPQQQTYGMMSLFNQIKSSLFQED